MPGLREKLAELREMVPEEPAAPAAAPPPPPEAPQEPPAPGVMINGLITSREHAGVISEGPTAEHPFLAITNGQETHIVRPNRINITHDRTGASTVDVEFDPIVVTAEAAMNSYFRAIRWVDSTGSYSITNASTNCTHDNGWFMSDSPSNYLIRDASWTEWNRDMRQAARSHIQASTEMLRTGTPEQQAARAALADRYRREDEERQLKITASRSRAEVLLQEHLSPAQQEELRLHGYFTVVVTDRVTQEVRRYRIFRGRSGNVHQVSATGRLIAKLCCHPIEGVPDADTMLAQKLWLENMEAAFLALANKTLADGKFIGGSRSQEDALDVLQDEERARRVISMLPANAA
jgi:hypothetical protein